MPGTAFRLAALRRAMKGSTDEEREIILQQLVLANYNVKLTLERLKSAGLPEVSERTLRGWKNIHSERLEQLQEQRDAWVAAGLADQADFLAAGWAEVERKAQRILLEMPDREWTSKGPNVVSSAGKNATISKGVNIDKGLHLRGKPTKITRSESSVADLLEEFHRRFPELQAGEPAIEGQAEEVEG